MASSTNTTSQTSTKYEKYLDERIAQTAMQVKWVELLSFFLTVSIFVLGLLFVFCLVDAWILELQVWMRWSALFILIACSLAYTIFKALPFFLHRVNPLYAAKKLEEGRPDLKNSVINYLTTDASAERKSARVIRQRMSQKAANDVANIPIDVSVDRSQMIVAGYILSAIVALFGLYKMLSPKDPFQTIGRVILPASDLLSPARVRISDLTPGDEKKYFGETVEISAKIKGLAQDEFPRVLVTSDDGRKKDAEVRLRFDERSKTFRATIGEEGGLKESFTYRIEAGDAKSLNYRIEVRTCPTIFVETIEYISPAYTEIPAQVVENPDSISGVEGTLCRINTRTNLPIESASIELFRQTRASGSKDGNPDNTEKSRFEKTKSIKLDVSDETLAVGSFTLELNAKRDAQRFSHYQVVFTSKEGDKSENPNRAEIEVIPDLKPEVEIVAPKDKVVEVPENQTEKISISAIDPDYGLTAIVLVAENRGNRLLEKLLFKSEGPRGSQGKQLVTFSFQPDQFGLQSGDEVIWYARAEDNRAVGNKQTLFPNRQRTTNYKFVITPPLKKETGGNPDTQDPGQPGKNKDQQPKESKEDPQPEKSGQENGNKSKQNKQSNKGGNSKQEKSGSSSSQGDSNSQKTKSDPGNGGQKGNDPQQSQGNQQSPGARQENNSSNKPRGNNDLDQGNAGQQNGNDSKGNSSKSSSDNRQANTEKSNSNPENGKPGGNPSPGEGKAQANGNQAKKSQASQGNSAAEKRGKPGNSKEAFERLKDYFDKEKGEPEKQEGESSTQGDRGHKNADSTKAGAQKSDNREPGKSNEKRKQQDPEQNSQGSGGEKKSSQGDSSSKDPGKNGQPAGKQNGVDPKQKSSGNDPGKSSLKKTDTKKPGSKQAYPDRANGKKKSNGPQESSNGKKGQEGDKADPASAGEPKGKSQDPTGGSQGQPPKDDDNKGTGQRKKQGNRPETSGSNNKNNSTQAEQTGKEGGKNPKGKNAKGKNSNASDQPGNNSGGSSGNVDSTSNHREKRNRDSNPKTAPGSPNGPVAQPDKANLDYARKTTEMVLEKLKDQKNRADEKLLKDLDWTEEELTEFVKRWESMRQKSKSGSRKDERQFEQALKSLGLKDPSLSRENQDLKNDAKTGYRQKSGTRKVPTDFAKKFRAIQKSQRKAKSRDD